MGQPIAVVEKPTSRPGILRFELNRSLTGMGHEHYRSAEDATKDLPADELARRLFETGKVTRVQIYSNIVNVELSEGSDGHGLAELIEELYIHYRPGVKPTVVP